MAKKKVLWHHVAMMYDRDGFHLFHNGAHVPVDALRTLFEKTGVSIIYSEWVSEPDMRDEAIKKKKRKKTNKKRKD